MSAVRTNDQRCAGRREREMVCSDCARMFILTEASWKSAERHPCPHCKSRDTTPMLAEYHDAYPVLIHGRDGGYI